MYKDYNDYELLYLIKDGDYRAEISLFEKYEYVTAKMFSLKNINGKISYIDFKQECLMCLFESIKSFDSNSNMPFFVYYNIVVNRRINRILSKRFFFNELNHISLNDIEISNDHKSKFNINKLLDELDIDDCTKKYFIEHYAYGVKITEIAKKNNLKYRDLYYRFKKIIEKLEKILTK